MNCWPRILPICGVCALFLTAFLAPAPLRAEPVGEACPARVAVLQALRALSARDGRGESAVPGADLDLRIENAGATYRVSVNGRTRSYSDPTGDCLERAQVAAVFAALVLSSPNAVDAEPVAPAPPAASAPLPAARTPPPHSVPAPSVRRWWFDAGAVLALAPGFGGPPFEAGAELRVAYVPGNFGAALGLRVPAAPALLPLGDATARILRYPIDVAARWVLQAPPFAGALDAGVVLSLLRVRQAEGGGPSTQNRLEAGLRLATRWQLERAAISPYAELFSEVIPTRYQLALEPTGVLAKTPALWLGATLGICAHFD